MLTFFLYKVQYRIKHIISYC